MYHERNTLNIKYIHARRRLMDQRFNEPLFKRNREGD